MKPLKLGMVGGGDGAFIGAVHRMAARLDGRFELVAGALSSTPEKARASAANLGLPEDRSYSDFNEMAVSEAKRPDGIDAVSIVTPNHVHEPAASAFLAQGIHVICDKPMTATMAQAETLRATAEASSAQFFLTHNYTGYPMVRHARQMVAEGALGRLRMVHAEYLQDWLTTAPDADNKQAAWRTDPAQAGGGAIGDIGTHAYNLACFVVGHAANQLRAELTSFVPGRAVDDNARVDLRFNDGLQGHVWASQVATGNENNLTLRIYGEEGSLSWAQENPNGLTFARFGEAPRKITRGGHGADTESNAVTRIPAGHPEGYLEAFATIYSEAADAIQGSRSEHLIGLEHGLQGVSFVHTCQQSSSDGASWLSL